MKPKKAKPRKSAPQPALTLDETIVKLYDEVATAAARSGLQVVLIVTASNGNWRARWGVIPVDLTVLLVVKFLTKLQQLLP